MTKKNQKLVCTEKCQSERLKEALVSALVCTEKCQSERLKEALVSALVCTEKCQSERLKGALVSALVCTEKCQSERLKEALVSSPVFAYPTREGNFVLDADVSATAIGAVPSQIQDGEENVIAYASCALSSFRQNYCTTYRELSLPMQAVLCPVSGKITVRRTESCTL